MPPPKFAALAFTAILAIIVGAPGMLEGTTGSALRLDGLASTGAPEASVAHLARVAGCEQDLSWACDDLQRGSDEMPAESSSSESGPPEVEVSSHADDAADARPTWGWRLVALGRAIARVEAPLTREMSSGVFRPPKSFGG